MESRLQMLEGHFAPNPSAKKQTVDDVWASINGDQFLSEKGITLRKKTRALMESLEKSLEKFINDTTFPIEVVPKLRELGVNGYHIKDFGGPGLSSVEGGVICYELAKIDASIMTFLTVHNSIGMAVIDYLGNEEQRQRILPPGIALTKILSFGLTEPDYGSDATSLQTTAKKVDGGYLINGVKRWIGNASLADYIIVWAKNVDDKNKIQGFLVEKGSKGLTTKKIENKYALRMVQNADIFMENVFVPDNNKLAKADDFATGTNKILEHSRIKVCWAAVGIAAGAYEAALKYAMERKQFGKPIASF
jgi:acyl-CoA oxidase